MSLSRMEQETIINFNEAEPTATIYTHNPALRRKLELLCEQRPGRYKAGPCVPGRRRRVHRAEALGEGERGADFIR